MSLKSTVLAICNTLGLHLKKLKETCYFNNTNYEKVKFIESLVCLVIEVIMTLSWDILYQEGQYYNFRRRKCSISCAFARGAQGIPTSLLSKIQ